MVAFTISLPLLALTVFSVLPFAASLPSRRSHGLLHPRQGTHPRSVSSSGHAKRYTPPSPSLPSVESHWPINSDSYHRLTSLLPNILDKAISTSTHSWEIGALTQALLEVYHPQLGSFDFKLANVATDVPDAFIQVTKAALADYDWTGSPSSSNAANATDIKNYISSNTSPHPLQSRPLVDGAGSLGDPASLAPAVWLLAELAGRNDVRQKYGLRSQADYAWAVGGQLRYVMEGSKSDNGTISMREGNFQVWSDMGYMIPPFAAYLGVTTSSHDLLTTALEQFQLESSALLDPSTQLYRHVNDFDPKPWVTGNGWMTMGLMRVLASVFSAGEASAQWDKIGPLENTIAGVFKALFNQLDDQNLIPNYMLQQDASLSRGDASGTALVVAAFYRFQMLAPWLVDEAMISAGQRAFDGVMSKVDDNGWLTQVVDPSGSNGFLVYLGSGTRSPEGQSFLGMMWAARTAANS